MLTTNQYMLIFSHIVPYKDLLACACVDKNWNLFFRSPKVWLRLCKLLWNPTLETKNDTIVINFDWRSYYITRSKKYDYIVYEENPKDYDI